MFGQILSEGARGEKPNALFFRPDSLMTIGAAGRHLTGTLLVLMLPIFFIGRVMQLLSQQAASTALGALGIGAGVAVIVGTIALIWKK